MNIYLFLLFSLPIYILALLYTHANTHTHTHTHTHSRVLSLALLLSYFLSCGGAWSLADDVSEKKLLSEISFPFIINMYASFKDTKFLYLVLEYSIGGGRTKACRLCSVN